MKNAEKIVSRHAIYVPERAELAQRVSEHLCLSKQVVIAVAVECEGPQSVVRPLAVELLEVRPRDNVIAHVDVGEQEPAVGDAAGAFEEE